MQMWIWNVGHTDLKGFDLGKPKNDTDVCKGLWQLYHSTLNSKEQYFFFLIPVQYVYLFFFIWFISTHVMFEKCLGFHYFVLLYTRK